MFPDSSDACISIETILSAHLAWGGGVKKIQWRARGGQKMAAGDGDHGYSPGTGVY